MLSKQDERAFSSVLRPSLMFGTDLKMSELAFNIFICKSLLFPCGNERWVIAAYIFKIFLLILSFRICLLLCECPWRTWFVEVVGIMR